MNLINNILIGLFGFAGGAISASGLFAILTIVGVINRYAKVSRTARYIKFYEEMIILGATLGNIFILFPISIPIGVIGTGIFGLASGIFIGSYLVCLSESIKALPIFIRRVRISSGLGYIILALGFGKGMGSLIYFLIIYVT